MVFFTIIIVAICILLWESFYYINLTIIAKLRKFIYWKKQLQVH